MKLLGRISHVVLSFLDIYKKSINMTMDLQLTLLGQQNRYVFHDQRIQKDSRALFVQAKICLS